MKEKINTKEVGGGGVACPSVAVASLSSPHWSSGGFPESPAVLNKAQSSTRQCSKTCYFPTSLKPRLEFLTERVQIRRRTETGNLRYLTVAPIRCAYWI